MSDMKKIGESRAQRRANSDRDARAMAAAEDAADALEGIRQDLTLLNDQMGRLIRIVSDFAAKKR
jgi:hypothetical protein